MKAEQITSIEVGQTGAVSETRRYVVCSMCEHCDGQTNPDIRGQDCSLVEMINGQIYGIFPVAASLCDANNAPHMQGLAEYYLVRK